jgi:Fic family protein
MEKARLTYVNALETVLDTCDLTDEVREKLDALKASLIKRNTKTGTRKPTKAQRENAEVKAQFVAFLTENGEKLKAGDVAAHFGVSVQKASALLKQLVDEGAVVKGEGEKRTTVFYVEA